MTTRVHINTSVSPLHLAFVLTRKRDSPGSILTVLCPSEPSQLPLFQTHALVRPEEIEPSSWGSAFSVVHAIALHLLLNLRVPSSITTAYKRHPGSDLGVPKASLSSSSPPAVNLWLGSVEHLVRIDPSHCPCFFTVFSGWLNHSWTFLT